MIKKVAVPQDAWVKVESDGAYIVYDDQATLYVEGANHFHPTDLDSEELILLAINDIRNVFEGIGKKWTVEQWPSIKPYLELLLEAKKKLEESLK